MKKKLISILIILAIFIGSGVLMFGQNEIYYDLFKNEWFPNIRDYLKVNAEL